VTGPTGSGKTTTLYAAINRIHSVEKKIITVEDPVEIQFDKMNQKQVTVHMGFADFTRSFLWQDPDVILVGEIRDQDTAQVAVRAANTGHLVLSALHTIDSTRAVTRMESLGVDPDMLATTLIGVLSQRLARKICVHCRTETSPTPLQASRLCISTSEQSFFTGTGCEKCNNGMKGRSAVMELFIPDDEIADMLARGDAIHLVRNHALAKGMRSLYQDAMIKARSGRIPLSEVLRVIPYRMIQEAAAGK
jgi:type II secretory ATPase GspE/PulE/Tfp pilus assembly ATPase PilB-like protein